MPSNRTLLVTGGVLLLGAAWIWFRRQDQPPAAAPVPEPSPRSRPPIPLPLSAELWQGIQDVAERLDMDPRHLAAVMAFESRLNPSAVNPYSGATGLIQFMPRTAANLGTTTAALGRMSALEQLPYVERYFAGFGGPFDTLQQVALTVFYPAYRNKPANTVFPENVRAVNPGIRTPADYVAKVVKAAERVLPPPEAVGPPEPQIAVVEAKTPPPIPEKMPTSPLSSLAPPGVLAAQQKVYSYARSFLTPSTSQGIPHVHRTI